MTATASTVRVAALPDGFHPPGEHDFARVLRTAHAPIAELTRRLREIHADVAPEWKFSPTVGWHRIYMRRKRRIFYLVPTHGDFRLSLILGGKAIDSLLHGPWAERVRPLMTNAKRYPEGTAFSFSSADFEPDVVAAMLEAKIAS